MARLVYHDQHGRERSVEIGPKQMLVRVGRNEDCQIQTNNSSVSREHAVIFYRDGRYYIQDPPSGPPTNGTKINGRPLARGDVAVLSEGFEIMCGKFVIRILGDNYQSTAQGNFAPNPYGQRYPYNAGTGNASHPSMQPAPMPGGMPGAAGRPKTHGAPGMNPMQGGAPGMNPMQGGAPGMNPMQGGAPGMNPMQGGVPGMMPANMMQPGAMPQGVRYQGALPPEVVKVLQENQETIEELTRVCNGKEEEIAKLSKELDSHKAVVTDLEHRGEQHDTVVDSLNETIKKLKEQLEYQKEQYQSSKRDLTSANDKVSELEYELGALKTMLESKGTATSNAETALASLKVQLSQKNRQVSELQRELDLTQFAVKEERENVESLQTNFDQLNENYAQSQKVIADMKKVLEQHEVMFSDFKARIDDKNAEIERIRQSLKTQGASPALLEEMDRLKADASRKQSEADSLREQLRSAELTIRKMQSGGASDGEAKSEGEIARLKAELERLSVEAGQKRDGGISADSLRELYDRLNDLVSKHRDNIDVMEGYISDLQRVFVVFLKIETSALMPQDRSRVETSLREVDPRVIFEEMAILVESEQKSLGDIKTNLKHLRSLLQN